ncbi:MAG: hypothetical protein AAFP84_21610 [Actinomycetota bacterium]
MPDAFASDKKSGQSILGPAERQLIDGAILKTLRFVDGAPR